MTVASAPRFRHALRQAWARARAHTRHTPDVCGTHFTWTWLCTRGKKRYKYCSFSHTNHSFCVLGHQCVVTMGNCLIWISLCMFFFPLIETVTYTCHYMTDRLERFDLKTSKLDLLKKKDTYILDTLGVSWYISNFNFKVNYPFNLVSTPLNLGCFSLFSNGIK